MREIHVAAAAATIAIARWGSRIECVSALVHHLALSCENLDTEHKALCSVSLMLGVILRPTLFGGRDRDPQGGLPY
jgi:hypothetical protein